ncbi:MAG: hypothetical protein L7S64_03590 [Longimicrobiales bacterium]|nr:hypothetical protein [Longimicrobiales bacterium]
MASTNNIWFQIGHAIERARHGVPAKGTSVASLRDRLAQREEERAQERQTRSPVPTSDDLMTAGVAMIVDRVLGSWGRRAEPGFTRLLRAAASGAAAALIVDLVRPLLRGEPGLPVLDRDTADRIIAGAGQGLVYGAVVEPRVPGPSLAKGVLFGSAEYMADPLGGVSGLLGQHAPQNRLPVVGDVLDRLEDHEQAWLEHVAFGIALAVIYESSDSSNGILNDEE